MARNRAVLTGDLIGSRKQGAAAVDASIAALERASRELEALYGKALRFTRHRGDGWQIVTGPQRALDACLALAARLRAADTGLATRIAIGVGAVDSPGTDDLSDASGPAFETSGRLLDDLTRSHGHERMTIAGAGIDRWPQAVIALADWIVRGWTPQQAEAVAMVLLDDTHQTNAKRAAALGISRQAFEARLKGSGLDALTIARGAFQGHDFDGASQ